MLTCSTHARSTACLATFTGRPRARETHLRSAHTDSRSLPLSPSRSSPVIHTDRPDDHFPKRRNHARDRDGALALPILVVSKRGKRHQQSKSIHSDQLALAIPVSSCWRSRRSRVINSTDTSVMVWPSSETEDWGHDINAPKRKHQNVRCLGYQ